MLLCDEAWEISCREEHQSNNCHDILSQTPPQLTAILYAYRLIADIYPGVVLLKIHFLLGLSWDELRAAICPLRGILGHDMARLQGLRTCDLDQTLLTKLDSDSILLELARGTLRVFGAVINREMEHWTSS
jgi:hypothetical protein